MISGVLIQTPDQPLAGVGRQVQDEFGLPGFDCHRRSAVRKADDPNDRTLAHGPDDRRRALIYYPNEGMSRIGCRNRGRCRWHCLGPQALPRSGMRQPYLRRFSTGSFSISCFESAGRALAVLPEFYAVGDDAPTIGAAAPVEPRKLIFRIFRGDRIALAQEGPSIDHHCGSPSLRMHTTKAGGPGVIGDAGPP